MQNITTEKASRMIRDSYSAKAKLKKTWDYADTYYNNVVNSADNFSDVTRLARKSPMSQDFVENLIPQLMRTYAAWVVSQRFDILAEPFGSKNDYAYNVVARTVEDCIRYYVTRPKFLSIIRTLAIRMKMYNAVAILDYYDDMRDEPGARIIPHTDIFFDQTAMAGVNEVGGPRVVAVRLLLTKDEAVNRYGPDRVASMPRGLISIFDEQRDINRGRDYYSEMYDVYQVYGYDYTLVDIPEDETRAIAAVEISEWINGMPGPVDQDIDHEIAVNEGLRIANEQILGNARNDELSPEIVFSQLAEQGLEQIADALMGWMREHLDYLESGDPGGSRAKYKSFAYKAEFQYGTDDWLVDPTDIEYSHGEIPVSFFRNHENTDGLFGAGPFTEVMNLHRRYERFRKAVTTYVEAVSRPPFLIDLDLVAPGYADSEKRRGFLDALKSGFMALFFRGSNSPGAMMPQFARMPPMSYDVHRENEYIEHKIREIIGPTRTMMGDVSGEVSGKAFAMRQASSAVPTNDVNTQIEGPMQAHMNRWATYILDYLPYEKIANISGPENADIIQRFRDADVYPECAVNVRFGKGMPNDWYTQAQWALQMYQLGLIDVRTLEEASTSRIKLKEPPPPPVTGQAQGGIQGVTQNA